MRSQKFVSEGDKTGGLGTEVPQWGPGAELWWGSGAKPPEAEDMLITIAKMCVHQKSLKSFFSAWEFPGGCPPCPPFPTRLRPCTEIVLYSVIALRH